MKIPELNHEQVDKFLEIEHVANTFAFTALPPEHRAKCHYLTALEIADEQGGLTKEFSLALKPDNWIEWKVNDFNNFIGTTKTFIDFTISYINKSTNLVGSAIEERPIIYFIDIYDNRNDFLIDGSKTAIYTLEEAKQHCQNWLDNHLKDRECLEN